MEEEFIYSIGLVPSVYKLIEEYNKILPLQDIIKNDLVFNIGANPCYKLVVGCNTINHNKVKILICITRDDLNEIKYDIYRYLYSRGITLDEVNINRIEYIINKIEDRRSIKQNTLIDFELYDRFWSIGYYNNDYGEVIDVDVNIE